MRIYGIIIGYGKISSQTCFPLLLMQSKDIQGVELIPYAVVEPIAHRRKAACLLSQSEGFPLRQYETLDLVNLRSIASGADAVVIFDCSSTACHLEHAIMIASAIEKYKLENIFFWCEKPQLPLALPERMDRMLELLTRHNEQFMVNYCESMSPQFQQGKDQKRE